MIPKRGVFSPDLDVTIAAHLLDGVGSMAVLEEVVSPGHTYDTVCVLLSVRRPKLVSLSD